MAATAILVASQRVFTYDFHPTKVPVLYGPDYWLNTKEKGSDFIETFLSDPSICRFYLGMSKLDPETAPGNVPIATSKALRVSMTSVSGAAIRSFQSAGST